MEQLNNETSTSGAEGLASRDWSNHFLSSDVLFCIGTVLGYIYISFYVGKSTNSLKIIHHKQKAILETATTICCFSILMTFATMAERIQTGKWKGLISSLWLQEKIGSLSAKELREEVYYTYEVESSKIGDLSFMLHGLSGSSWIVFGYAAIYTAITDTKKHKLVAKLSIASYVLFVSFALLLLWIDIPGHHIMNKAGLMSNHVKSLMYLTLGIVAVRDKTKNFSTRVDKHLMNLFKCYVYSVEGSGQIRLVGHVNYIFKRPTHITCIDKKYRFDSGCMYPYMERMCLIRTVSHLYMGIYVFKYPTDVHMKKYLGKVLCIDFLAIIFMQLAQKYDLANWIFCYTCISMLRDVSRIIKVLIYGGNDEIPSTNNGVKKKLVKAQ